MKILLILLVVLSLVMVMFLIRQSYKMLRQVQKEADENQKK